MSRVGEADLLARIDAVLDGHEGQRSSEQGLTVYEPGGPASEGWWTTRGGIDRAGATRADREWLAARRDGGG